MSAALGRVTAYVARLRFAGLLERCRVTGVLRGSGRSWLSLGWSVADTTAQPGTVVWQATATVGLPDDETDAQWTRRVLEQVADVCGHEIGEAVLLVEVAP